MTGAPLKQALIQVVRFAPRELYLHPLDLFEPPLPFFRIGGFLEIPSRAIHLMQELSPILLPVFSQTFLELFTTISPEGLAQTGSPCLRSI